MEPHPPQEDSIFKLKYTKETEKLLRQLIQFSDASEFTKEPRPRAPPERRKELIKRKLSKIYDELAGEGFSNQQIETAFQNLYPKHGEFSLDDAFEWLCLNLSSDDIPSKFSSGIQQRTGEVKVILDSQTPKQMINKNEVKEALKPHRNVITLNLEKKKEEERQKSVKDWTKQYIQKWNEKNTGNDDGSTSDEVEDWEKDIGSDDDDIHTRDEDDSIWEIWADYREISRRKQLRSGLKREDKVVLLAKDFFRAKNESSDPKTKANKKKQKEVGSIIQELKQEMKEYGILEKEIYSLEGCKNLDKYKEEERKKVENRKKEMESLPVFGDFFEEDDVFENNVHEKQNDKTTIHDDAKATTTATDFDSTIPKDFTSDAAPSGAEGNERNVNEIKIEANHANLNEGEDVDLPNLFNDEVGEREGETELLDRLEFSRKKQELISSWKIKEEKGIKGSKKSKQIPKLQPKALLQQYCQVNSYSAPSFQKLAESFTSTKIKKFLYSVSISKKVNKVMKNVAQGEITFKLPTEVEGFDSISEAQNAVSAYVLYSLTSEKDLYNSFDEKYQEMLLDWCLKGTEKAGKMESEMNRREEFLSTLLSYSGNTIKSTSELLNDLDLEQDDSLISENSNSEFINRRFRQLRSRENDSKTKAISKGLLQEFEVLRNHTGYKRMLQFRLSLPIASKREIFLSILNENDSVIVCGETGSGKTTQIPQFILDDMIMNERGALCNIVCTQPRKIAAISVAERVSSERCENELKNMKSLIGYQVRLDSKRSSFTRVLFCTTGILLRQLSGDHLLLDVSHVVVDEIHERTMQSDFLLAVLKSVQLKRKVNNLPPLKIILMSATLDSKIFSEYFLGCPVVFVEGRTFSVKNIFLEDIYESLNYKLLSDAQCALRSSAAYSRENKKVISGAGKKKKLVKEGWGDESSNSAQILNPFYDPDLYQNYSRTTRSNLSLLNEDVIDYDLLELLIFFIDENYEQGAILVFLPGISEIRTIHDRLSLSKSFRSSNSYWLITLHSSISSQDQSKAFVAPPPGIRKIILATNIAETSITIDDVVFVIDSGKVRENRYDPKKSMTSLVESWISKSNAKQRFGRAGRVKEGICFCLYTKHRYEKVMRDYQIPEIQRLPLVELCLQIKVLNLGSVENFLKSVVEPPSDQAIKEAMSTLFEVGALDLDENLTSLGNHLATLPVDIRLGKIMIMGCVLGCLSTILTIASCLSHKSPFVIPQDQKDISDQLYQLFCVSNSNKDESDKKEKEEPNNFKAICVNQNSDHLVMSAAYNGWKNAGKQGGRISASKFCQKYYCNSQTMEMIRDLRLQFGDLLADIGFLSPPSSDKVWKDDWIDDPSQAWNINSNNPCVVKAVLCAGLYPNVAVMDDVSMLAFNRGSTQTRSTLFQSTSSIELRDKPRWTDTKFELFIHPSSVNSSSRKFQWPFIVYHEKVKTAKLFVRDCSTISPFSLVLFGGKINIDYKSSIISLDSRYRFSSPAQISVLFKQARAAMDQFLHQLILNPRIESSTISNGVIPTIIKLLMEENK